MLKNIVVVNDFDYIQGGASKVAIQTANVLAESKYDLNVYFFSAVHDDKSNLNEKVIQVCSNQKEALKEKNKIKGFFNGLYNFKSKKKFKELLKTLDNDETIIHVHGWTKALSSSVFDIAFKMNFKVVLTMHDYFTACPNGGYFNYKKNEICHLKPLSWKCIKCNCDSRNYFFKLYRILRQFIQNKIVKLNDKLTDVISISDFSEKILKETLNPKTKIHKVYNPIQRYDDKTINILNNKNYLYVGRITKEKGVDLFCEAITQLDLPGIVVGDGPQFDNLSSKYSNINFVGWKNSEDVREFMKKSRCLVMPSRWYECAPLTNLEALEIGIPSLVSDCCAASDVSRIDLNTGNTFELSIEDLKNKLIDFNIVPSKKDIDRVLKKYDYNGYLKRLIEEYDNILGGN